MNLTVRDSIEEDAPLLTKWLSEPNILQWFPMINQREIDDSVRIWLSFAKMGASLTVECDGAVCGMSLLYIQPYKKLSHNCLFSVIIDEKLRGKGIGTFLLQKTMERAKEKFHIEILHLEVYDGNPAKRLYERLGFETFGKQEHFIKEKGEYRAKFLMQKFL